MNNNRPPFFLLGMPRSGTKLLRELINSQPDIWVPNVESNFIPYVSTILRNNLRNYDDFKSFASVISKSKSFMYWNQQGVKTDCDEWFKRCQSLTAEGVITGLFRLVYEQSDRATEVAWEHIRWGDKSPSYIVYVNELHKLFPQAQFIHIVRDPRDVALSSNDAWGKHRLRAVQRWVDGISLLRSAVVNLPVNKYYEIRYEDLLVNPKETVKNIVTFLGCTFHGDCFGLQRPSENLGSTKGSNEVVVSNCGKYKERMQERERRIIEVIAGQIMDIYGYEREFDNQPMGRLSSLKMSYYKTHDAIQLLLFAKRYWGNWKDALRFLSYR